MIRAVGVDTMGGKSPWGVTVMAHPYRQPMYPWPAPESGFVADDLHDLPYDGHRYEILERSLHVAPPPPIAHHRIADAIRSDLAAAAPIGWSAVRGAGVTIGDSLLFPDVAVLRPEVDIHAAWTDPGHVALVVEIESMGSRKQDRFAKPALYAEAEIDSFWRIEPTEGGPVLHLYEAPSGGHYRAHRAINPGESPLVELPYPVQVAPATWAA